MALVIRPEHVHRLKDAEPADVAATGIVTEAIFLGAHVKYVLSLPGGGILRLQDAAENGRAGIGDTMRIGWNLSAQRVLEDR